MKAIAGIVFAASVGLAAAPSFAQSGRPDTTALQQSQILARLGGAYDGPQAAYVGRVGERMAEAAGLPGRCVFRIVDSEVVNALTAPPGCYVYVTRGLLAVLNSEAELAAVLGHELGHVAANHARRQKNQETVTGLAAVLAGAVTGSDLVGSVAGRVAQLGSLSYSRSQEYEADTLALRYLPQAGYAADGLARVLDALQREEAFDTRVAGKRTGDAPAWASTHPLTADRIQRAERQAAQAPPGDGLILDEAAYLAAVDGLPYGDDAAKGYARGVAFVHPRLRIAFDAPAGASLVNLDDAVRINGPGELRAEFAGGGPPPRGLEDYAIQVLGGLVGGARVDVGRPQKTTINGLEAVVLPARGAAQGRPVEITVVAYALDGKAYHFVAVAPAGQAAAFDPMFGSFRRASDRETTVVARRRIEVTTVRPGDTPESLAARMAPDPLPLGRFRMLNGLDDGQPLTAGDRVKLVVERRR